MTQLRKFSVACATFAVAGGIGFVMQNGDALASRMNGADVVTMEEGTDLPELPPLVQSTFLPVAVSNTIAEDPMETNIFAPIDMAVPLSMTIAPTVAAIAIAQPEPAIVPAVAVVTAPMAPLLELAAFDTSIKDVCAPSLIASVAPAAMVNLRFSASCAPNEVITFHHQGMIFTVQSDVNGIAQVVVPALADQAVFMAELAGTLGSIAMVTVPDVAQFDRAVLQWQGNTGLQLHAREFGAGTNTDGHVWENTAGQTQAGSGGYMVQLGDVLGDAAAVAQVYTYPSGNSLAQGSIDLTVEVEVTDRNCGQNIAAQSMQFSPQGSMTALDLEVTFPACDAVGEYLVLNNMLADLTLAAK